MLTLLGVSLIVFLLVHALPGNPVRMIAGKHASAEQVALIEQAKGFDRSLPIQFLFYLNDLSPVGISSADAGIEDWIVWKAFDVGDYTIAFKSPYLGRSFANEVRVNQLIKEGLPESLVLAIVAILLALVAGIPAGVASARRPNSWLDRFLTILTTSGMAIPSFLLAILLGWVFGYVLRDFTGLTMTGSLFTYDIGAGREVLSLQHLILPAITLSFRPFCVIAQLMRSSMQEVLGKEYITTARAKGLPEKVVVYRHALVNAVAPSITAAFTWLASLAAGSVFVEYVFGWNGLGQLVINAIDYRDFPVIVGMTLFASFVFVIVNALLNLIYPWLDPTIRS